jgi:4-hydroxy-2-oxoheptanedioate aldolase
MSDSPVVMELVALAGYGHMIIDHEHSPTDSASGQVLLQAIDAARWASATTTTTAATATTIVTEPIIRVPDHDATYMKKILDSLRLPGGVLVPMVEDAETAAKVVAATRYPLQLSDDNDNAAAVGGIRGCAVPFVRASGYGRNPEYMRHCQEDLLVMVQVETEKGVQAIPEIAAVPGLDGIFLGPFDLSCSIGKVGQFDDEQVNELIQTAEQAVRKSDCFLAGFRSSGRDLKKMFEDDGYSLVCGSIDLGLLREAARQDVEAANEIIGLS